MMSMLKAKARPATLILALILVAAGLAASTVSADGGRGQGIAIAAQEAHNDQLLSTPGVAGTGVGLDADGNAVVVVYLEHGNAAANVPDVLDDVPVRKVVTGRFNAYAPPPLTAEFTWSCSGLACSFDGSATVGKGKKTYEWDFDASDGLTVDATGKTVSHEYGASGTYTVTLNVSTKDEASNQSHQVTTGSGECAPDKRCSRPVPIGVSVGHPEITAGTIGARVTDGTDVFVLSNNHVLANENLASIGDPAIQPGDFDGGSAPADTIGTLDDFEPIVFDDATANNTMDAAIALSSVALLDRSTLTDGYGTPSNSPVEASLGLPVQKNGRTTGWTLGEISEINVTVNICYEGQVTCTKSARFVDQLAITPGEFSAGGDSGSLIVTQSGNRPVGLLFAGSSARTLANRIQPVLARFGVTIDGDDPPATGAVSGTITDSVTGSPIEGAGVSADTGESTTTDVNGVYTLMDVPVGNRDITASASGYASKTQPASVSENTTTLGVDFALVAQTDPTDVSVASFAYSGSGGRNGDKHVSITVALVDNLGDPVSGASVSVTVTPDVGSPASGTATTGPGGTVTFTWSNAPGECYVTNVTDVTASGLNWDSVASSNTHTEPACKSDFPTVRP